MKKEQKKDISTLILFAFGAPCLMFMGALALENGERGMAFLGIMGSIYIMLLMHALLVAWFIERALDRDREQKNKKSEIPKEDNEH